MTLDRTNDGYYVYAMPSIGGGYSLTDIWGKPYYLLSHPNGKEIIFAANNQIYFASSIGESQYRQLTYDLIKNNPDFYHSLYPGSDGNNSQNNGSSTNNSNSGQTCNHCYGNGKCSSCAGTGYMNNPYTGNTMLCPNCENNHNGICKFCHGRGVR